MKFQMPELVLSKKGQVFLAVLLILAFRRVLGLSDQDCLQILGLASSYLVGQGIADHGKEAAKIENQAPALPTSPPGPPAP